MSGLNWTGLIAICTVMGTLGGLLLVGFHLTAHFVRMTDAVESGSQTIGRVEKGMEILLQKLLDHDDRFSQTNDRLDRLEDLIMTDDQRAESTVKQIARIGPHRKRRIQ